MASSKGTPASMAGARWIAAVALLAMLGGLTAIEVLLLGQDLLAGVVFPLAAAIVGAAAVMLFRPPAAAAVARLPMRGTRSVLVCEVKGYESLPPGDAVAIVQDFQTALGTSLQKRGGRIDRTSGDAIVCVFGELPAAEGHAPAAVQAALTLQADAARLQRKWVFEGKRGLSVRIAVGTGFAHSGDVPDGDGNIRNTTFGSSVTLAWRLAAKAPPGGVLVGEETRAASGDRFEFEAMPGLVLRGLPDGYRAYLVVGPKLESDPERGTARISAHAEVAVRAGSQSGTGRVENVSAGGMYVRSQVVPMIGDVIEVEFPPLPDSPGGASVVVKGEVRHNRPAADGSNGFGMSIEQADSAKAESMRHFVALYLGTSDAVSSTRIEGPSGESLRMEVTGPTARLVREK